MNVAYSLVVGATVGYAYDMTVNQNIAMLAQNFFGFQFISPQIAKPLIFASGTAFVVLFHNFAPALGMNVNLASQAVFGGMFTYYLPSLTYLASALSGGLVADVNSDIGSAEADIASWWNKKNAKQ